MENDQKPIDTPEQREKQEIDHLVSQYGKDPMRFIDTVQGKLSTPDEILLKHRSDAIAISEGRSHGRDIGDSITEALAALDRYYKAQASKDMVEVIGNGKSDSPHNMNAHTEREILRIKQRKTAQSKGYKLEGVN